MEHERDEIRRCTCDLCDTRGLVVVLSHLGTDVLALCRWCAPKNFEAASRRAINEWLGLPAAAAS